MEPRPGLDEGCFFVLFDLTLDTGLRNWMHYRIGDLYHGSWIEDLPEWREATASLLVDRILLVKDQEWGFVE